MNADGQMHKKPLSLAHRASSTKTFVTAAVVVLALGSTSLVHSAAAAVGMGIVLLCTVAAFTAQADALVVLFTASVAFSSVQVGPLRVSDMLVGGLCLAGLHHVASRAAVASALRAAAALVLLLVCTFEFLFDPPETIGGSYVAYESTLLAACILALSLQRQVDASVVALAGSLAGLAIFAGTSAIAISRRSGSDFEQSRQLASVFGGSNYVAVLAGAAAILVLGVWLRGAVSGTLALPALAFLSAVPVIMASRNAVLWLVVVGTVIFARRGALSPMKTAIAAGLAAAIAYGFGGLLFDRIATFNGSTWFSERTSLWSDSWALFVQEPLGGVGLGHLADTLAGNHLSWYSHNIVLSLLAQFGVLGLIAVFVFIPWAGLQLSESHGAAALYLAATAMLEPTIDTLRLGMIMALITGHVYITQKRSRS